METTRCPQCNAAVPVDSGYSAWCDQCGWNVDPFPPAPPRGRVAQRAAALGDDLDASLRAAAETGLGTGSGAKRLALALAAAVHLVTLVLVGLAVALMLGHVVTGPVRIFFLVLLVLVVLATAPRLRGLPKRLRTIGRSDAAALWKLVERVAQAVGAPAPAFIVVDGDFNAWSAVVGVRRRRVLGIGMALWTTTTPAEHVALLGHELAHGRPGNCRYNVLIQSAREAMRQWARLLGLARAKPSRTGTYIYNTALADYQVAQFVGVGLFNVLTAVPRRMLVWWSRMLEVATARASQHTEYGADQAAVTAASTQATLDLLDHLYLTDVVEAWEHRYAVLQREPDWADLERTVEAVPPRQLERIRRIGRLRRQRIDASHPSTAARIDVVRARQPSAGAVYLSDGEDAAITAELTRFTTRSRAAR